MDDFLNPSHWQGLRHHLASHHPGWWLEVVDHIDSTNSALCQRARESVERTVLVAHRQSQGRGRQGRAWQALAGASLTFSVGLPLRPAQGWGGLSLAVGVALAQALQPHGDEAGGRLGLKWPNDLWWTGPRPDSTPRKLGGILIESVAQPLLPPEARMVVVGVGLNIAPQHWDGLSSGLACVQEWQPQASVPGVLAQVLPPLLDALHRFEAQGWPAFQADWSGLDVLRGRAVQLSAGPLREGVAEGVSGDGSLWVRDAQGQRHAVASGEVSVRPLASGPASG